MQAQWELHKNIGLPGDEVITFRDIAVGDPDDSPYVPVIQ